jgi:cytoskeleton protein RodZ
MTFELSIVGKALKEKREELGLTVSDIAKTLNLRNVMVKALESGEWKALPHEVYVRGYLKEYGKFLGIQEVVNALLVQDRIPEVEPVPVASAVSGKPMREATLTTLSKLKRVPKRILLSIAVLGLIGAIFLLRDGERTPMIGPDLGKTTRSVSESNISPQPVGHDVSGDKKLMITCHERTWLSIVIDGTEKKVFMLNPEEVVLLNGQDRFDLLVGNAGGIKIFLNGKDTGFSGENREVKRVTLS